MRRLNVRHLVLPAVLSVLAAVPIAHGQDHGTKLGPDSTLQSAVPDSLLQSFSPEELIRYREFYRKEIDRMQQEIRALREHGIRSGEDFLHHHPESQVADKVLLRLAEFYYYKAQEDFQKRMEQYEHELALYDSGKVSELPPEPRKDYSRVFEIYRKIIEAYPQSKYVDDALYNIAFLLEDEGRKSEALEFYQRLVDAHPNSPYVPDALMRMAEYYFNPPVNQLDRAIELYKKILAYHDTPRYDEALYRLGWAHFRLSDYPNAIAYFTLLADDIELAKQLDPAQKISNPALQDESIEYIGISFLDYGGPNRAARYITDIGDRSYGFKILKKIGDVYFDEKEEYAKAIEAYQVLLRLYPDHPQAPLVQNRIVLAYRKLEDEEMASLERLRLFERYGENSEWWQQHADEPEVLRVAQKLARQALADNLGLLLRRAQENEDTASYREYVRQARIFLNSFAGDTLAPQVHWNMAVILDTKLGHRDEAYRQYIALSNTYLGSRYQKMAAENAVALASEVVEAEVDSARRYAAELTPQEERLVEAYDNFIRLFPDDEQTGLMLSSAGALFYNHRRFNDALRYFKTLVKRFPGSPYIEQARLAILESYFGKRDYRSTEIAAKRILTQTENPELHEKAKRRLAEAIFLTADSLSRGGYHDRAGAEFARVAAEVPDAEFADLALFKAGTEYEQARKFEEAVSAYEHLLTAYPGSRYKLDAMNNLALDYGELKRFQEAAVTYEKLADLQPDSSKAQNALYNASVFYVRAEDWRSAIRVNRRYVERYPESEEADDLFFDIASYYLKLGELASANQIYGEYAERFPNSPRVVESFFHRGEYFRQKGDLDLAQAEYRKAVEKAEELRRRGLEGNDYFEAEALFALAEIQFREYQSIRFTLPEDRLRENKRRKTELLKELVEAYSKVAKFGTQRLYQATFRIGQVYQDYAETWASQEVAETDPARRAVKLKAIDEEAAKLYERAVDSYLNAASVLEKIAREYAASHPDTANRLTAEGRVIPEDTTLVAAKRWIEQSKAKATEVVYKIAEVTFQAAKRLLTAPVPPELGPVAELEYWHQLYSKAIVPIVQRTLLQHQRNLVMADTLGINTEWVERSRRSLTEVSLLIASGYRLLADSALARYSRAVYRYAEILPKADSSVEAENQSYELATQVGHFLDYTKAFAKVSQEQYAAAFAKLDTIASLAPIVTQYADEYLASSYRFARRSDSLAALAEQWRELALKLKKATGSYIWDDGSLTFEDAYFALEDVQRLVLEHAYAVADSLDLNSPWVGEIVLSLIQEDPSKYAPVVGLQLKQDTLVIDQSWHVALVDSADQDSMSQPIRLEVARDFGDGGGPHIPLFTLRLAPASDSAKAPDSSVTGGIRIERQIPLYGLPADGSIEISASAPYDLYVNGEYIAHVETDSAGAPQVHVHDLRNFLVQGSNRVEIVMPRSDAETVQIGGRLRFAYLPDWENHRRRLGLASQDRQLERYLYFDKNRIPDWQLSGGSHDQNLANHDFDGHVDDGANRP